MFFWFDRDNRSTKLPKVRPKSNNKHLSNGNHPKHVTFSEKNQTVYPKYSPLPAINSKYPHKKLERQRTYVVTNPVFVKPIKPPKQRKKPMTFKDFKKNLNKKNKTNTDESGLIWVDL
ncbi:Hypothetical protein CINCED_3A022546 [Cinara cedri]|uniref:Uncharacterized protein n=1 Tax=Cinara cedri TaxID=506608 RepID=A0A5E4NMI5_9HEMI|nr:Hypothetical protein CINCED_3A022546 [Cinara cedri]